MIGRVLKVKNHKMWVDGVPNGESLTWLFCYSRPYETHDFIDEGIRPGDLVEVELAPGSFYFVAKCKK